MNDRAPSRRLLRDSNTAHELPPALRNLDFGAPKVLLTARAGDAWDSFGVRDPALLVDEHGRLVRENGELVMYYTGSRGDGNWQAAGRAVAAKAHGPWRRDPTEPVLAPAPGEWDSSCATNPWVIRFDDGLYRLYYRGSKWPGHGECVGLAVSEDGRTFRRSQRNPLLTPDDFPDIARNRRHFMAVINVARLHDGRFLLTFESQSISCGNRTQIYGAVSDDGERFTPMKNGMPLFTHRDVASWPVERVANPRITLIPGTGTYMLIFNGHQRRHYSLGIAFTDDFETWWEHPDNPVLVPTGWPAHDPFSGRLESGLIPCDLLDQQGATATMLFFGIPLAGPSNKGSVIAAVDSRAPGGEPRENFHTPVRNPGSVRVVSGDDGDRSNGLVLDDPGGDQGRTQAVFFTTPTGPLRSLSAEVKLQGERRGWLEITVADCLGSRFTHRCLRVALRPREVQTWYPRSRSARWKILRSIAQLIERASPSIGWRRLAKAELTQWRRLELRAVEGWWTIALDGRALHRVPAKLVSRSEPTTLVLACVDQLAELRDLRIESDGERLER